MNLLLLPLPPLGVQEDQHPQTQGASIHLLTLHLPPPADYPAGQPWGQFQIIPWRVGQRHKISLLHSAQLQHEGPPLQEGSSALKSGVATGQIRLMSQLATENLKWEPATVWALFWKLKRLEHVTASGTSHTAGGYPSSIFYYLRSTLSALVGALAICMATSWSL